MVEPVNYTRPIEPRLIHRDPGLREFRIGTPDIYCKFGQDVPKSLEEALTDVRVPPIRSSAISTFEGCPRKFLYRERLGLKPKGYSSALSIGQVFHRVLQAMFTGQPPEEALDAASAMAQKTACEIRGQADEVGMVGNHDAESLVKKAEEDYHKARAMAWAFMQFAPFDWSEWEILTHPDGTPMVECLLSATIPGISVPLVAPCDLALVNKDTREVWIVDHKTTSMNTRDRANSVRISAQMSLYRLVLQCHLDAWARTGEQGVPLYREEPQREVVGSIHNIVKKPGIKYCPLTKDKEGFPHYLDRLLTWYKETHAADPKNSPIFQSQTRFSEPVLPDEVYLRLRQMARASRAAPDIHRFYRAGDYACLNFNSVCPFLCLCSSAPAMWPGLIRDRFQISFREDEEED